MGYSEELNPGSAKASDIYLLLKIFEQKLTILIK